MGDVASGSVVFPGPPRFKRISDNLADGASYAAAALLAGERSNVQPPEGPHRLERKSRDFRIRDGLAFSCEDGHASLQRGWK